jgi:ketosteroid isomerase-like protein
MGTDAASGVIVYGNETRVMRNGKKWQMDLMEIFYFDLDGKISSIVQFARP